MIATALAAAPSAHAAGYGDAVLAHDPLTYLRMEETSGTVAHDSSPNHRDGTYANAALGTAGPFADAGKAVSLDHSGSVTASVGAVSASVELWVNPARLAKGQQQAFVAHGDPAGDGWSLGIGAKRKLVFITRGKAVTSRVSIPSGTWTMVAATWDGAKVRFYVNGGATTKVVSLSTTPASSGGQVQIGGTGFGSFTGAYAGRIDELALFPHVLSATEIRGDFGASSLPYNTAAPVVTGTPKQGQTLGVQPGSWAGASGALHHQWQRCDVLGEDCDDVVGATGSTYVLGGADVGFTIQVVETASNAFGAVAAESAPTAVVEGLPGGADPGAGGGTDPGAGAGTDPGTDTSPGTTGGTPTAPAASSTTSSGAPAAGGVEGAAAGRCVRLVSRRRAMRVRRLGRVRVRTALGGCIRRKAGLRITFRSRHGKRVRSVRYRLDGKRLRHTRRFAASVRRSRLRPGRHVLEVRVAPRHGRARVVSLRLRVAVR